MVSRQTFRQIFSFGIVGVVAFLSDAVVLTVTRRLFDVDLISARLCAFVITVTLTWWLNRRITFRSDAAPRKEWMQYSAVNGVGMILNVGLFFLLVFQVPMFARAPVAALAAAAIVTMTYSFLASKYIVFRTASSRSH